ncbi:MAG: hypothetical protein VX730_01375 [Pseudomonadota bacterium]|nr:hypothetical protein [Pseudomonadota bacterium]
MAITAIAGAAAKAGAAAGKAGGFAAKGAGRVAKGAAKKAGKAAKNKVKRGILSRVLSFFANPIVQAIIAIPFPVAIISNQIIPSISKEIKIIKMVLALFAGGGEAAIAWPIIIIGLAATAAGAAAGNAICDWSWCTKLGAMIGAGIGTLTGGATIAGTMALIFHTSLIALAWFILVFKFVIKSVLPKRM